MSGLKRGIAPQARAEAVERLPPQQDQQSPSQAVAPHDGSERRRAQLLRTIEMEVVPRLLLASRAVTQCEASSEETVSLLDSATVEEFVELILDHDPVMAVAYFEALRARGVSIEAIYLHLLTPAARRLGELWCEDLCDFTKVTLALGRLQQLLRELSPDFRCETESRQHGRRALLMPAPGEQHTFGLFMVAEFFRRGGWDVWSGLPGAGDDVIGLVRAEWFDIVGLSVGSESRVDGLSATIRTIRRGSRNRAIGVMVGGPLFVKNPELAAVVGADATALDGRQAAQQAASIVSLLAAPRRY